MLVCVIDDDPEDVELFSEALRDVDPEIEFLEFQRIPSAIDHFRNHLRMPAYVFLDAHLPSGDSTDVIREIRNDTNSRDVKIFIYSGFVSDDEKAEFKRIGATDVITKPNQFTELRTMLAKMIGKKTS